MAEIVLHWYVFVQLLYLTTNSHIIIILMRSRSPVSMQPYSPLQQPQQAKKYYSREQVSQILRAMMESKLSKIYEQLQQKQQMIRSLNQKLNRNDSYLQNSSKQMYELASQCSHSSEAQLESTVELINTMINDKLQLYWHNVQSQLDKIRTDCHQGITKYHQALQDKAGRMISDIRNKCEESVDNFKKKNNTYWIKVKQALNKMNARTVQSQEKITIIGMQINKFENEREENAKTLKELQNGQNTAKMLVQLKKSVSNVYKNFEEVLKLQQAVKQRYESMGGMSKLGCEKCTRTGNDVIQSNKPSWNMDRNRIKSKQDDIVILEYSMEQDTLSNHQVQNSIPIQEKTRPYSKSVNPVGFMPRANSPRKKSQGEISQQVFPLSPITGKVIQQSSMNSNTIEMLTSDRFKYLNPNMSTKNQTNEWGEHDEYMGTNGYGQFANNQLQSNSFQLHSSGNPAVGMGTLHNSNANSRFLYTPSNPASTSMLNFSLDCRKEMLESVRPRLVEMIDTKGLIKPIRVFMDQINYLKNEEGNYLFDLKGNMFKLTSAEFGELQRDRIIFNVKAQDKTKNKRAN